MKSPSLKLVSIIFLGLIFSQNCLAGKKNNKQNAISNTVSDAQSNAASDVNNAHSNAASDKNNAKSKKNDKKKTASNAKSDNYVNVTISNNTDYPIKIRGSHLGKQHDTKSGIIKRTRVSKIYTQETASGATTGSGTILIAAHGHAVYKLNTNKQYEYTPVQIKSHNNEVDLASKHGNDFDSMHTWTVTATAAGFNSAKRSASSVTAATVKNNAPASTARAAKVTIASNAASNDNSLSGSGM